MNAENPNIVPLKEINEQEKFCRNKMEIKEAQTIVNKRIEDLGGYWQPLSMLARITEELGELARAINIKYGEKKAKYEGDGREIEKELGDVAFTLLAISNRCNVNLENALKKKMGEDYEIDKQTYIKNK